MAFVFNPLTGGYTLATEESPIQAPVAETPATAGISSVSGATYALPEWLNQFNNLEGADYSAIQGLVSPVGGSDWVFNDDREGTAKLGWNLTPEATKRLQEYKVNADVRDDGETNWNTLLDPSGAAVGELTTPYGKESWFDKFNYGGGMVALLGAAGLSGFDPSSLFGGEAAGASAADIAAMGDVGMGAYGTPIPYTSEFAGLGSLASQGASAADIAAMGDVGMGAPGPSAADIAAMGDVGMGANGAPIPYTPSGISGGVLDKFKNWAAANPLQAIQAGSLIAGKLLGKDTSSGGIGSLTDQSGITANKPAAFKREYVAPPAGYRPGIDPEHKYFK